MKMRNSVFGVCVIGVALGAIPAEAKQTWTLSRSQIIRAEIQEASCYLYIKIGGDQKVAESDDVVYAGKKGYISEVYPTRSKVTMLSTVDEKLCDSERLGDWVRPTIVIQPTDWTKFRRFQGINCFLEIRGGKKTGQMSGDPVTFANYPGTLSQVFADKSEVRFSGVQSEGQCKNLKDWERIAKENAEKTRAEKEEADAAEEKKEEAYLKQWEAACKAERKKHTEVKCYSRQFAPASARKDKKNAYKACKNKYNQISITHPGDSQTKLCETWCCTSKDRGH